MLRYPLTTSLFQSRPIHLLMVTILNFAQSISVLSGSIRSRMRRPHRLDPAGCNCGSLVCGRTDSQRTCSIQFPDEFNAPSGVGLVMVVTFLPILKPLGGSWVEVGEAKSAKKRP